MDYEKKYKQLHTLISDLYPFMSEYCKEKVEGFFPELKESEDEKIRKELLEIFKENKGPIYISLTPKKKSFLISLLEKQGALNDSDVKDYNSIDPHFAKPIDMVEPKFKNGQWIVWQNKCYKVNYNGCGYELIDQNGLRTSLEYGTVDKSAHLLTIDDVQNACKLGAKWQKKHDVSEDWSEEDEEHIHSLLDRLEGMCKKGSTFITTRFAVNQDIDWLKSLKGRVQPQPKQEWSEEDEELVKWSINNLTELKDRFDEEYGKVGKCIDWLKSLIPQNHWKTSKEQMSRLKWIAHQKARRL